MRVTFTLAAPDAESVFVLGDFNDWRGTDPMSRAPDGTWQLTLTLDPDREYQFRYLLDGTGWQNDAAADRYVPNAYGSDNSVVVT